MMASPEISHRVHDQFRRVPFGRGAVQCNGREHFADERGRVGMRVAVCDCKDGAEQAAKRRTTTVIFD